MSCGGMIMLQLFDTLYSFDYDGDLSPYLAAEEKEDYQMALDHQTLSGQPLVVNSLSLGNKNCFHCRSLLIFLTEK